MYIKNTLRKKLVVCLCYCAPLNLSPLKLGVQCQIINIMKAHKTASSFQDYLFLALQKHHEQYENCIISLQTPTPLRLYQAKVTAIILFLSLGQAGFAALP